MIFVSIVSESYSELYQTAAVFLSAIRMQVATTEKNKYVQYKCRHQLK